MGLKAVFFDMDDTLVLTTEADKQACGQVGELAKLLHPEVDQAVLIEDWHRRFVEAPWDPDMKVPVPEWRAAHWKDALQDQAVEAPETAAELQRLFDAARIELFRFEPAVKELAANLKSSGVRCIIITNGHADIQRTKLEACRAAHLFDAILVGGEEVQAGRFEKPHPSIFLAACRLACCQPCEAVHIGDNLVTDVAGANRAGLMASVWVNRGAKPLPGGLELDCRPTHTVKHVTDAGPILAGMMSQDC